MKHSRFLFIPFIIGHTSRWFVLLDAAKSCSTHPPNLAQHPADFVGISFYKVCSFSPPNLLILKLVAVSSMRRMLPFQIFGYPTGIGALIIRKGSFSPSTSFQINKLLLTASCPCRRASLFKESLLWWRSEATLCLCNSQIPPKTLNE